MALYALTIFLSAFLLFQVQPLIGRYVLPWFGGTPGVWTTCLLFFQCVLVAGYSYAHLVVSRLPVRKQGWLHLGLLVGSLLLLPIIPSTAWKPIGDENPLPRILLLLARTVGIPYLMVSSTGPLLQGWFSRTYPGRSPYRLYALSNIGSLLALLTYPVVFERYLRLPVQAWSWSGGYVLFVLLCGFVAWQLQKNAVDEPVVAEQPVDDDQPRAGVADVILWLLLAACGTTMLMATTNRLCQDVAVVPFLWVLPLSLYLLSFIICFDKESWYSRIPWTVALVVAVAYECKVLLEPTGYILSRQVLIYSATLFCSCMVAHGELVKMRPGPRQLTLFYLMVSLGGAVGGLFVSLLAPRVFLGFWELHTGLVMVAILLLVLMSRDWIRDWVQVPTPERSRARQTFQALVLIASSVGAVFMVIVLTRNIAEARESAIARRRNFYGVLRVVREQEHDDSGDWRRVLSHGTTRHGHQYERADRQQEHTSYYGAQSGVGLSLLHHPRRGADGQGPLRFACIGLGTGTVATYALQGDYCRYYEINPQVKELAEKYFTFMSGARQRGADFDVFMGDARIVMEHQLKSGQSQQLDVLAVDAFSSDAIPVHLLTRECFRLYWQHLKPDGILAVHITNRYLDLSPVVRKLAQIEGKQAVLVDLDGDEKGLYHSIWVLVTSNTAFLTSPDVRDRVDAWDPKSRPPLEWNDNFSNLMEVLEK